MGKLRVAVIGAGTAGCGCARRAAELGASEVTLIEKETPAAGSSSRSAGIYNAQALDSLSIEIRLRARELFFRLNAEGKLPLEKIGNMRVGKTEEDMARFKESIEIQKEFGATDAQLLDPSDVKRIIPDLKVDDVAGGLFGPNDGQFDGYLQCNALVDEAKSFGARILSNAEVTGYKRNGKAHVISTSKGDVECDVIVNAGGAWAKRLGDLIGYPAYVNPEVHEIIRVRLPKRLDYVVPQTNFYVPGQKGEAVYFRQDGPDALIAGLHTYDSVNGLLIDDPDHYSPPDGDSYLHEVATQVSERLQIEDLGFKYGWNGLYPLSADGAFQVGPYKADPTVVVVAGLGGVGVTTGAILGAIAAEWIVLGKPVTVPRADVLLPDRPTLTNPPRQAA